MVFLGLNFRVKYLYLYEFFIIVKYLYCLFCFVKMFIFDYVVVRYFIVKISNFFFNRVGIVIFYLVWLILNMLMIRFKELFFFVCKLNRIEKKKYWLYSVYVYGINIEWNIVICSFFFLKIIENWINIV